jgi:hypothetical protein
MGWLRRLVWSLVCTSTLQLDNSGSLDYRIYDPAGDGKTRLEHEQWVQRLGQSELAN